jgi:hypothetical protein
MIQSYSGAWSTVAVARCEDCESLVTSHRTLEHYELASHTLGDSAGFITSNQIRRNPTILITGWFGADRDAHELFVLKRISDLSCLLVI